MYVVGRVVRTTPRARAIHRRRAAGRGGWAPALGHCTVAPRLGNFFAPFFRRRRRQIDAGADDGGASPAHVLAPPHPPMMRAHPPALPLSIRAVP